MTTDREQFEAAISKLWRLSTSAFRRELDCYIDGEVQCAWIGWQAARAAPAQQDRPSTPIGWSDSDWIKHLQSLRIPSELLLLANDPLMGQALLRLIERAAPAQPDIERCERESETCVQVHSKERLGDCTPENCRYTAPAQPAGEQPD